MLSKKVAIIAGEYHKETVKKMINEADSVLAEHKLTLLDTVSNTHLTLPTPPYV